MDRMNIALLVGGVSPESAVSKETCEAIYNALNKFNYNITLIDPGYGINQPDDIKDFFKKEDYKPKSVENILEVLHSDLLNDIDLVFFGLHGDWGEDGRIQSVLEMRKIKYTGSGVLASALAMDKARTKVLLRYNGVPTADWLLIENYPKDLFEIKEKIKQDIGIPFVVKPNTGGSSVGLSKCNSVEELDKAIDLAFRFTDSVLIEKYIKGRELTVGILGDKVLPVLEIKPTKEFYDYECKYTDGMSEYEVPAKIDDEVTESIQKCAQKAFSAVGCRHYSRIDFLLDENNNFYCLEINTLPGMTSHSLVPKAAAYIGIAFPELINKIITLALNDETK